MNITPMKVIYILAELETINIIINNVIAIIIPIKTNVLSFKQHTPLSSFTSLLPKIKEYPTYTNYPQYYNTYTIYYFENFLKFYFLNYNTV